MQYVSDKIIYNVILRSIVFQLKYIVDGLKSHTSNVGIIKDLSVKLKEWKKF